MKDILKKLSDIESKSLLNESTVVSELKVTPPAQAEPEIPGRQENIKSLNDWIIACKKLFADVEFKGSKEFARAVTNGRMVIGVWDGTEGHIDPVGISESDDTEMSDNGGDHQSRDPRDQEDEEIEINEAGKVTDPVALKVKDIAKKFFGEKPYSSARIANGAVHRLSFMVMGRYRYVPLSEISPLDKQKLLNLKNGFLEEIKQNGISLSVVDVKFHVGAGVYISVRTKLSQNVDLDKEMQEDGVAQASLAEATHISTVKKVLSDVNKLLKSRGYKLVSKTPATWTKKVDGGVAYFEVDIKDSDYIGWAEGEIRKNGKKEAWNSGDSQPEDVISYAMEYSEEETTIEEGYNDKREVWQEYKDNAANNAHTENLLLMAKKVGDKKDVALATELLKDNELKGYSAPENEFSRSELNKKLWPTFRHHYGHGDSIPEGMGDTLKKAGKKVVKSIRRGAQLWDKDITDSPRDVVSRNKGYNDEEVLRLRGKEGENPIKHSPRHLQNRVLDKEIKKRGLSNESALTEKSTSEKQARTMAAVAHGWKPTKKDIDVPKKVAKEFNKADKGTKQLSKAMKHKKTNEDPITGAILGGLAGVALGAKGAYHAGKNTNPIKGTVKDYAKNFAKGVVDPRTYLPKKKETTESKQTMKKHTVVTESQSFSVSSPELANILRHFKKEITDFNMGGDLDDDLYQRLYDYWFDDMPYGTKKARTGDPYEWVSERLSDELGSNENVSHPEDATTASTGTSHPAIHGGANWRFGEGLEEGNDSDSEIEALDGAEYVQDLANGTEVFRMLGDPYERRVQIVDKQGRGWNISPSRLTPVFDERLIARWFPNEGDIDEGAAGDIMPMENTIDGHEQMCIYCGKDVPPGVEPTQFRCCGEVGHTVGIPDDESVIHEGDEDDLCATCSGSGEGQYDGTRCRTCGGSGTVGSSDYGDEGPEWERDDELDEVSNPLPWDDEVDVHNSKEHPCYDCGSTIARHHTPLCDFAAPGDKLDLPAQPGSQHWTGETPVGLDEAGGEEVDWHNQMASQAAARAPAPQPSPAQLAPMPTAKFAVMSKGASGMTQVQKFDDEQSAMTYARKLQSQGIPYKVSNPQNESLEEGEGWLDEAFLVEDNEELITEILEEVGLDHGLDFFFDGGLVAIGKSTARVIINALKADPRISETPAISNIDGEEVQITFNKQAKMSAPELKVDDIPAADFDPDTKNVLAMGESTVTELKIPSKSSLQKEIARVKSQIESAGGKVSQNDPLAVKLRTFEKKLATMNESESGRKMFDTYAQADRHFSALAHEDGVSPIDRYARGDAGHYAAFVKKHVKPKAVKEDVSMSITAQGEDDVVNIIRKLSGLSPDAASTGPQSAQSTMQSMPAMLAHIDSAQAEPEDDVHGFEVVADEPEMEESEYANEPDPTVHTSTTDMINQGNDLNRPKKSYSDRPYRGDNPMAESRKLLKQYEAFKNEVKAK